MYKATIINDKMKRTDEELVNYFFTKCCFPIGLYLMTGSFWCQKKDLFYLAETQAKSRLKVSDL